MRIYCCMELRSEVEKSRPNATAKPMTAHITAISLLVAAAHQRTASPDGSMADPCAYFRLEEGRRMK